MNYIRFENTNPDLGVCKLQVYTMASIDMFINHQYLLECKEKLFKFVFLVEPAGGDEGRERRRIEYLPFIFRGLSHLPIMVRVSKDLYFFSYL